MKLNCKPLLLSVLVGLAIAGAIHAAEIWATIDHEPRQLKQAKLICDAVDEISTPTLPNLNAGIVAMQNDTVEAITWDWPACADPDSIDKCVPADLCTTGGRCAEFAQYTCDLKNWTEGSNMKVAGWCVFNCVDAGEHQLLTAAACP